MVEIVYYRDAAFGSAQMYIYNILSEREKKKSPILFTVVVDTPHILAQGYLQLFQRLPPIHRLDQSNSSLSFKFGSHMN